jgi:MoxR-like ATPase
MRQNLAAEFPHANAIIHPEDIMKAREMVKLVYMMRKLKNIFLDLVFATRYPADYKLSQYENMIQYGGSPRPLSALPWPAKHMHSSKEGDM